MVHDEKLVERQALGSSWLKAGRKDAEVLSDIFRGKKHEILECRAFLEHVLQQSFSAQEYAMLTQLDFTEFETNLSECLECLIAFKKDSLDKAVLLMQNHQAASLSSQTTGHPYALPVCKEPALAVLFKDGTGTVASQYYLFRVCQSTRDVMDTLACPCALSIQWAGQDAEILLAASGTAYCPVSEWLKKRCVI